MQGKRWHQRDRQTESIKSGEARAEAGGGNESCEIRQEISEGLSEAVRGKRRG